MESQEMLFLRDQVQRLNAALAKYQDNYLPVFESSQPRPKEESEKPWLIDKNVMSPLLKEYDAAIQVFQDQIGVYKQEQKDMRIRVDKLVAENKRLMQELKEVVQTQLEQLDVSTVGVGASVGEDQVLQNLQVQLQMAIQEKESAMEMWQAAVQEVERMERRLQIQEVDPEKQTLELQATKIKEQYLKAVSDLNKEISRLQDELRLSKTEQKAGQIQVSDLRSTLEEMRNQLLKKEQERAFSHGKGEAVTSKVEELKNTNAELESKLADSYQEVAQLKTDHNILDQKITEFQKKSTESGQREYEAVLQVKDSVQMVENAILEKDQALIREQQANEQLRRMQEVISGIVEEAGVRTRQEVDNVKKQCNQNIGKLMEEIHSLELENSEKQAQIDRAVREKRAVESELEKLYQEGLVQGNKESGVYEEVNRRACNAERTRDEALVKMESMQTQIMRAEMGFHQEKSQLQSELKQIRDWMEQMKQEFDVVSSERVKLVEEIDQIKRKMEKVKQEKVSAQRNFRKELAMMENDIKSKEKEYEVKIQSLEDNHRHAILELRQLLSSQQRMSAKWKEECQTITQKFERKVSELRSEATRMKKRNEELSKLLNETRDKILERHS